MIPGLLEGTTPTFGLKVTATVRGNIMPDINIYFDVKTDRLERFDYRDNFYRLSAWKQQGDVSYPSKTVIYKRATGREWCFHEILDLQRLTTLPSGLTR
jgi:hypothetical protein